VAYQLKLENKNVKLLINNLNATSATPIALFKPASPLPSQLNSNNNKTDDKVVSNNSSCIE
jgi:hypothetical protein